MPVSVCCCLCIAGKYQLLKCSKNLEKSYKKSARRKTPEGRRGARGAPPPGQVPAWRGQGGGHARWPPGKVGPPLVSSFRLYFCLPPKTLERTSVTRFSPLFRRRSDSKIGIVRRPHPGTLPEGGIMSGSFSTTMSASRMCRE